MSTRRLRALGLGLGLTVLAACTVGPDYKLPENSMYSKVQKHPMALDARGSAAVTASQPAIEGQWWKLYDDPELNGLVEQALQTNSELKVAAARLTQAQASYAQARAAGGWSENVDASLQRGRIDAQSLLLTEPLPIYNFANTTLSVSYDFDLFGKIRRGVEAARADTEAVLAANDLARINVAASVVGAYVEICHSNHELAVAHHSLDLQQHSSQIAERFRAAGRGTPTAVERADAQAAVLEASIPTLESRKQAAGYELAALLGRTPDQVPAEALRCEDAPGLKQPIPLGDGATLLRRRPDVRRAERELAAATAEIGVATAELYPNISFGASAGSYGILQDFGKPVTHEWSFGPLLSWSIPGRGAHARVALAKAGADVALAEFDHVVLEALRETQTVLATYAADLRRETSLRAARDHARSAAEDVRKLYLAGREPYLSSLDADRTLASAEANLANGEAQVSQDQIRLFFALGGGWQERTPSGTPAGQPTASTNKP